MTRPPVAPVGRATPPPMSLDELRAAAERVTVETRKAYTIVIGGKKRRFWTEAAAYYALAKYLLGAKYLLALSEVDAWRQTVDQNTPENIDEIRTLDGAPSPATEMRAVRARSLFYVAEDVSGYGHYDMHWCSERWTKYVRRVAKKLRAMDARRAAESSGSLPEARVHEREEG